MILYLHIPFCDSKCSYCAFNSYTHLSSLKQKYMNSILVQLKYEIKKANLKQNSISSVFIGGGTPSSVRAPLYRPFFDLLFPYLKKNIEITSEANPNSASLVWLEGMRGLGVNRISFGVQSFNDDKLRLLGRNHTSFIALNAVANAKRAGYKNISIDLMYGLAMDTKKILFEDIKTASSLDINHISAYSLTLEENTPFYNQKGVQKDSFVLAKYFHKTLDEHGFSPYEISNFQRGYKCKHNIGYWRYKKYIGVGSGAVGFDGKSRSYTQNDLHLYIDDPTSIKYEELSKDDIILEKIFLGLRSFIGIRLSILPLKIREKIDILVCEGKLYIKKERVYNPNYFLSDEIALFLTS